MNEFVSIEILGTIVGCSAVVTLLTQVFKRFIPEKVDTKWLALIFSVIIGVLRIFYIAQYDFDGIVSGIINIFVLLSVAIGIYEISDTAARSVKQIVGRKK
jgi:hypothetical protein